MWEDLLLRVLHVDLVLVVHVSLVRLLCATRRWEDALIRNLCCEVLTLWAVEGWTVLLLVKQAWAELLMECEVALLLCCQLCTLLLLELSLFGPVLLELGINHSPGFLWHCGDWRSWWCLVLRRVVLWTSLVVRDVGGVVVSVVGLRRRVRHD